MATRSAIGVEVENEIRAVYCHWDGYVDNNGQILQEHYDLDKTLKLIELGDLSSLGPEIGEKRPFDNPHKYGTKEFRAWDEEHRKFCNFYGRDRGESGTAYRTYQNADDFFNNFNSGEEYFYLLARDGHWYVRESRDTTVSWRRLDTVIAELQTDEA
jgi:hypothetical protein